MAKYISSSKITKNLTLFEENLKSYRLISSALATSDIPKEFSQMETKNLFYQTIRELDLSEIETTVWIIILDRIGWNNYNYSLKTILCLTGLQSKINLGLCVQNNIKRFLEKMPNIDKDLSLWCSDHPVSPEITVNDINQKYKVLHLTTDKDLFNYNFYVDDILAISIEYAKNTEVQRKRKILKKKLNQQDSTALADDFFNDVDFPKID